MVDAFTNHAVAQLSTLGNVRARSMFGGVGIYCDGLMFALTVDEALYFKVDETTRPEFEALGLGPFTYQSRGKTHTMGYFLAPEEVLEDPRAAQEWGSAALAVARRAASGRSGGRSGPGKRREPDTQGPPA